MLTGRSRTLPLVSGISKGAAADPGLIIVVGAGVAGLSAARVLKDHGMKVVVVEGRNRIGGRTSTVSIAGGLADEGAAWIDGTPANPLYSMVTKAGLQLREMNYFDPWRIQIYDGVASCWFGKMASIWGLLRSQLIDTKLYSGRQNESDTVKTLAAQFNRKLHGEKGSDASQRLLRFLLFTESELNSGECAELMPAEPHLIGQDYKGDQSMIVGGYGRLVELLAEGLDVRLEETVRAIRYDAEGVSVVSDRTEFNGTHAVITVPLGVLKAKHITFEPELPSTKWEAIDSLALGYLEKLVLRFDHPFWRARANQKQNVFYVSPTPGEFPAFF